jgi:hypothetical protein
VTALYTAILVASAGIFKGIAGISEGFEEMGYSMRLIAPAVNKALLLRQALLESYSRAGVDLKKVIQQSILFNFSLTKTKYALEAIYKSVGARFLPLLTKQMDIFRAKIYANMPKIQATLEKFIKVIFKAFQATVILGGRVWSILGRVWDFFAKLDEATKGWSTKILLAIAAWELLNLAFLASPLGYVLAGLVAILALFDDFETWKEGGQSLFDWSKFVPIINAVSNAIGYVVNVGKELWGVFGKIFDALQLMASGNSKGFFDLLSMAGNGALAVFKELWDVIKAIAGGIDSIGDLIGTKIKNSISGVFQGALSNPFLGALGGSQASPALGGINQPQPLVNRNGGNNQKVSQETNITVQGSADANATGKAVASEQSKVNFDMTRNLKGATR